MTAVRSFRGLGKTPPTVWGRCHEVTEGDGAVSLPNKHLVFSFAVRHKIQCLLFLLRCSAYFSPVGFAYHAGFRCSVSEFVERMRHLSPPLRSAVSRSRSSVMLSIIIGVNILNWHGAVIAQSGRQFDESGGCFFTEHML